MSAVAIVAVQTSPGLTASQFEEARRILAVNAQNEQLKRDNALHDLLDAVENHEPLARQAAQLAFRVMTDVTMGRIRLGGAVKQRYDSLSRDVIRACKKSAL